MTIKKEQQNFENIFKRLCAINVNEYISKRLNGKVELSYLSWADALQLLYSEFKDEEVTYIIHENTTRDNLPIFGTSQIGYYVKTSITICNITREMILPVMDGNNNYLKDEPYSYTTKYGEKTVGTINIFEINKAIMRCLVKNIALFGLGLYIYRGDDLPSEEKEKEKQLEKQLEKEKEKQLEKEKEKQLDIIRNIIIKHNDILPQITKDWVNVNILNNPNVSLYAIENATIDLTNRGYTL